MSLRQHRFHFLLGDPGKSGRRTQLAVDAYYPDLSLVVEYHERQHFEAVNHFDKPNTLTVSGVHRGMQRRLYDERRRDVLPQHGITLLNLLCTQFASSSARRLKRLPEDERVVRFELEKVGAIFVAENGEGPGVRLRKNP
ncbi:hypothetical protein [Ancylobacter sp. 3268]|uniref:hypothetical protein n=1 Tax=Ancylobacter sp. 3268 TaxID=2817752 RepID=UPI00286B3D03|nr:hypothetical protein [Ancylobacter sp. 3268]